MFAMILVTISLLSVIPYFAFVFAFLQPLHVVDRIRAHTFRRLRRAIPGIRPSMRQGVIDGADQLEDIALNSVEQADRAIAMAGVNQLLRLLLDYQPLRERFSDTWFRVDDDLADDPDLIYPATEREHLYRWHGGNTRLDTSGQPLDPSFPEEF